MAFFNEFPHTRTYDTDLAWLIERMKELLTKVDKVDELLEKVQELMNTLPAEIRERVQELFDRLIESGYFQTLINELLTPYVDMRNSIFVASNSYENTNDHVAITKLVCNVVGNIAIIAYTAKWTETRTLAAVTGLTPYFQGLKNSNNVSFLQWLESKKNSLMLDDEYRVTGLPCHLYSGAGGNYSDQYIPTVVLDIETLWQSPTVSTTLRGGVLIPRNALVNVEYTNTVMLPII